ncbi:MAG: PBP1 and LysM peptidoglycan-binding domain-containing protein [Bacteroidia bacterium]
MKKLLYHFLFFMLLVVAPSLHAQTDGTIKKSKKIEVIDGKKYYIHTVEKGQTLFAIAKAYDLTVNDIQQENPDAINGIKKGQLLRIPTQKTVAPIVVNTQNKSPIIDTSDYFIHLVEQGQTLYSITRMYNVSEERVMLLNPEIKNGLKAGQRLKIPGKSKDGTPTIPTDSVPKFLKKEVYHVAVMLPLRLYAVNEIDTKLIIEDKARMNPKQEIAVQFYEGCLLAVDSMRKRGMKIKLHVYDVDEGDSLNVVKLLKTDELKAIDLFIGPLYPAPFVPVAEFAKAKHIAAVSPVSPVNKILFKNPSVSKCTPSLSTQMEQLSRHLSTTYTQDNIVLVYSGNIKEVGPANTFRKSMNGYLFPTGNDSIRSCKGMAGLEALLKKDRTNVLVVPSNSQAFVSDLMRSLSTLSEKYKLVVFGLSSWKEYETLDPEYLQKVQFHYVSPYFVDYDAPAVKHFQRRYAQVFQGDPGQFTFIGYDVMLFYLSALEQGGLGFSEQLGTKPWDGLQQRFDFYRTDVESGFENRGVRVVKLEDYRYVPEK